MNQTNCVFCFPIDSPLIIGQNNFFNLIYNIAPVLPGHVLVIPKRHVERFDCLTAGELSALMPFCSQAISVIKEAFAPKGFDITIQDGVAAGQTIQHMHVHIISRYINDFPNPGDWYPVLQKSQIEAIDSGERKRHTQTELLQITAQLRTIFNRIV